MAPCKNPLVRLSRQALCAGPLRGTPLAVSNSCIQQAPKARLEANSSNHAILPLRGLCAGPFQDTYSNT